MADSWVIYGATGYTGQLLAEEAIRRGHRPLLAGRSEEKLAALAGRLGLEYTVASLQDRAALARTVGEARLVLHAAGPFVDTSAPMLRACLEAGAHYVDITGEIPVFQNTFAHDAEARDRKVALLSGAGFDVVPSDCLAKYVAGRLPGASKLELAIAGGIDRSAGTALSALGMIPRGNLVRKGGELVSIPFGEGARRIAFSDRERDALPIPWGDLETAWRSTGIPDITTYMALPPEMIRVLRRAGGLLQRALSVKPVLALAERIAAATSHGPGEEQRRSGRSYFWARASDDKGREAQAWLETMEPYQLTAVAAVRIVERILAGGLAGAHTPATAFGADFVLSLDGTLRFDERPNGRKSA